MVRTASRRSRRTASPRAPSPRPRRSRSRESSLSELVHFLTDRLPRFIADEFEQIDIARSESELFRELANLPDSTLREIGLRREDLPRFVLSAFHLINTSRNRRGSSRGRRSAAGTTAAAR